MSNVTDQLHRFRAHPRPPERAGGNPLTLSSKLAEPATADEIAEAWPDRSVPQDAIDAWTTAREARLFEDIQYGQWGLILLSPAASADRTANECNARPDDLRPDDLVLGEFLGDQELLVISGDDHRILIALPLDDRADWDTAAADLGEFLALYWRNGGDKFWER